MIHVRHLTPRTADGLDSSPAIHPARAIVLAVLGTTLITIAVALAAAPQRQDVGGAAAQVVVTAPRR